MALPPLNVLHLCSGCGAFELALRIAGQEARTVCHVEREAYAAAILAARMEDGSLDASPVWSDLHTFDGAAWRGCVDLVTSGIPCQPYSAAGQRKGNDDERALWPEMVRIVAECEPGMVFIENVPGFLHHAEPVWRELRGLGFEWRPPLLATASHFGAPHIRQRLFLLAAHPDRCLHAGGEETPEREAQQRAAPERADREPAHPDREELRDEPRRGSGPSRAEAAEPGDDGAAHAHPHKRRLSREWQCWVFDPERQTLRHDVVRCGPGCSVCGSPWEAISPAVRVVDGTATELGSRVDELRAIGNGIVPHVAAKAWLELSGRL